MLTWTKKFNQLINKVIESYAYFMYNSFYYLTKIINSITRLTCEFEFWEFGHIYTIGFVLFFQSGEFQFKTFLWFCWNICNLTSPESIKNNIVSLSN